LKKYLSTFRNSSFFNGLTDEEILSALHCIDAKALRKRSGEYILRAGDSTDFMGLVLSGTVMIIQEDLWGHRNIIAKVGVGELFAELFAATPNTILNVSVVANENCEILFLNTKHLLTVCPSACRCHNKIIHNLVATLAKKMLLLNDKMTHMSKRTTREKLLSYLSSESIRQGKLSFDIPFDRQQLADFLCVERAAMSVELSKLQKEGILETNKKHFKLYANESNMS